MATRPAKRQRRSKVTVSDDEDDAIVSSPLPVRTQKSGTTSSRHTKRASQTGSQQHSSKTFFTLSQEASLTNPSPKSSPQKARKNKQILPLQNNKSLHSFFNRATAEERWRRKEDTPEQASQEGYIVDDITDDESVDEALVQSAQGSTVQQVAAPPSKPFPGSRLNGSRSSTPGASQRFTKPTVSCRAADVSAANTEQDSNTEHTPWADRFGPSSIDELAVHKKKVADVQKWLEDVNAGRSPQKILVLKGPAGSGKSTTITLVTQTLGVEVISWRNPAVSDTGLASSIQQFADFLEQGSQFEALSFASAGMTSSQSSRSDQQILVVEEFPTIITRSSNVLASFRSTLLQHILRPAQSSHLGAHSTLTSSYRPVVLIISESLLTSSTALSDSFTAHRLLGPELSHHPLVSVVEFNPVAPTFISKAIDLVIKKEARESKRRRLPGPAVLQQLAEVGDIRSAINSLEFLCVRGDDASDWSGTVAARSKKGSKGNVPLTEVEKTALQMINLRESTLDMFHATGKIVYNKREDPRVQDSRAEPPPKPPDHLMYLYTPKASQVDVDALLNETGTDIQTFISTLHENFVLSCNGDDFVDTFDGCARFLSDSDVLNPESRGLVRKKGSVRTSHVQSGNSESLRQDEISFNIATRGLLFSLPFPVNRAVAAGMRKQDAFKMFYPASLRLWKPAEEIYELVSLYAGAVNHGDVLSSITHKRADGVASWKSRSLAMGLMPSLADEVEDFHPQARSFFSRNNLATESLPYLTLIKTARKEDVQTLNKITQLRGINLSGDELLDEEQYHGQASLPSASTKLQQKVEEAHNALQAQRLRSFRTAPSSTTRPSQGKEVDTQASTEKMYISDDDIQDD